jgi:hypothetical protein
MMILQWNDSKLPWLKVYNIAPDVNAVKLQFQRYRHHLKKIYCVSPLKFFRVRLERALDLQILNEAEKTFQCKPGMGEIEIYPLSST